MKSDDHLLTGIYLLFKLKWIVSNPRKPKSADNCDFGYFYLLIPNQNGAIRCHTICEIKLSKTVYQKLCIQNTPYRNPKSVTFSI